MEDKLSKNGLDRRTKIHVKSKEHEFFAICQPGFEDCLKDELISLGIENFTESDIGGIGFKGKIEDCYRVCLGSRGANRVIMRLFSFRAENFHTLKKKLSSYPWELYIKPGTKLKYSITCRKSRLYHTKRIEEEFSAVLNQKLDLDNYSKDCLESFSMEESSLCIFVRFVKDRCTVSIDASAPELFRRGYRKFTAHAPLRESTAYMILKSAGFENYDALIDPMCGSGTFSLEAHNYFSGRLAGENKNFAFENWTVFKKNNFEHVKRNLKDTLKDFSNEKSIYTFDIDKEAIECASKNFESSAIDTKIIHKDFFDIKRSSFKEEKLLLVLNPPYGKRIERSNAALLYKKIGEKLKSDFKNSTVLIIVPGKDLEKSLNIKHKDKILFMNGGIRVSLLKILV